MSDVLNSEALGTVMGAVVLLFLLVLMLKIGPLRFIGEMLAHLAFKIVFLVLAIGVLFVFIETDIGQSLGGISTALYLIFGAPFVLLIIGMAQARRRPGPKDKEEDVDDDR